MRVRLLKLEDRKKSKRAERLGDRAAQQSGRASQRQKRNAFVPNPLAWAIVEAPDPLEGERLD